jgi:hypothetical protein
VRDKTRPIVITGAASDPILLAVAHGALALPSRDRISTPSADLDRPTGQAYGLAA